MTTHADLELRRNGLVLCFLNSILLPIDHSPALICSWKTSPCGICVPSNFQWYLFQREQVEIDCDPMTVALQCTGVNNRSVSFPLNTPFWVCQWNDKEEEVPAGVWPRQLEIRLSILTISLFILPRIVEAMLVILFPHVTRGRPAACVCLQQQLKHSFFVSVSESRNHLAVSCDHIGHVQSS